MPIVERADPDLPDSLTALDSLSVPFSPKKEERSARWMIMRFES